MGQRTRLCQQPRAEGAVLHLTIPRQAHDSATTLKLFPADADMPPHLLESVAETLAALSREPPSERPLPPLSTVYGATLVSVGCLVVL